MDTLLIAQLFAVVWIVVGLGMLMNTKHYMGMIKAFKGDSLVIYFGGVLALVVGFLLVTYHNVWEQSWMVIITIVGWLALLKGLGLLLFPKAFLNWAMGMYKTEGSLRVMALIVLALGLILGYYGGLFGAIA